MKQPNECPKRHIDGKCPHKGLAIDILAPKPDSIYCVHETACAARNNKRGNTQ